MNKGLKIFIGALIVLIAVCGIAFCMKPKEIAKEELKDTVIITDGKIENENLIDEFIEEDYQKEYGYYIFSINGEEKSRHNALRWQIKRETKEGIVKLYFYSITDVTEFPNICEYDLEGSNYVQKFKISYNQRKDLGIKTIIDRNTSDQYNYSVCTFGGDVTNDR